MDDEGRYDETAVGPRYVLLSVKSEAHRSANDREHFLDVLMDVLPGDRAARGDVEVDDQATTTGIFSTDSDHHALAGYWVLIYFSCFAHLFS
jgi:hypothetical protein